jgi:hypothetical protein
MQPINSCWRIQILALLLEEEPTSHVTKLSITAASRNDFKLYRLQELSLSHAE